MSDLWFYRLFGEEFGPVPRTKLLSLMATGTLADTDEVRPIDSPGWQTAASAVGPALAENTRVATASEVTTDDVNWYCRTAGQAAGPFSFDDLLRLAEHGELTSADEVRYGTDGKWRSVGSMGRLVAVLPFQESTALRPPNMAPALPETTARASVPGGEQAQEPAEPLSGSTTSASEAPQPSCPVKPAAQPRTIASPRIAPHDASPSTPSAPATPVTAPPPSKPAISSAARSAPPKPASMQSTAIPRAHRVSGSTGRLDSLKNPKVLGSVGVILLAVLWLFGGALIPRSKSGDLKKLAALQDLLIEFRSLRDKQASDAEWESFSTKAAKITQPMVAELKNTASRRAPAKQFLLWSARDRFPEMLQNARDKPTSSEQDFEGHLYDAARYLGVASGAPPAASSEARASSVERGD
jgi:hypothetical protein